MLRQAEAGCWGKLRLAGAKEDLIDIMDHTLGMMLRHAE